MPHASSAWSVEVLPRRLFSELRFTEPRIHAELLRLVLENAITSTLPVVLLSLVLTYTLYNEQNHLALIAWFAVVVSGKLASHAVAKHYLATPPQGEQAYSVAWMMVGFYALSGFSWGALPWLALDTATVAGKIFVFSVMAGVIGSAMAQTSSLLIVFLAFGISTLSMVAVKLLGLQDPAYTAFAVVTVIYLINLYSLARNNAASARSTVELRFENVELLGQLRNETEQAEQARQEAERANAAKSKFLAAASHDLRQPVHAQGLFLSVLATTSLNPQQRELLDNIRNSAASASEMLETLLDFSRIEAGVIRPNKRPVALQPLLYKLEAELAPQADAMGLLYRTRETSLSVYSDPALLELVLRNLISNAIRYTEQGGLLVGARRRGDEVALEVWDTGIGIDPGQQQDIFQEFHQLGNPERDRSKGLGLGLAIANGLSGVLHHQLSLGSRPGRGSVFRLTMAAYQEPAREETSIRPQPFGVSLQARTLIIDDEESVRNGMLHLLTQWGCDCRAAEGVEDAQQLVRSWRPQLIVSDYRLRERRTGADAIFALRRQLGEDVPALLITGDTAPERLREAQQSGIPLLHKPVAPEQFHYHLNQLLVDTRQCEVVER